MSTPEQPSDGASRDDGTEQGIPPSAPAYSTPPPEGLPSADDKDGTE